jgi:hypothetical protein
MPSWSLTGVSLCLAFAAFTSFGVTLANLHTYWQLLRRHRSLLEHEQKPKQQKKIEIECYSEDHKQRLTDYLSTNRHAVHQHCKLDLPVLDRVSADFTESNWALVRLPYRIRTHNTAYVLEMSNCNIDSDVPITVIGYEENNHIPLTLLVRSESERTRVFSGHDSLVRLVCLGGTFEDVEIVVTTVPVTSFLPPSSTLPLQPPSSLPSPALSLPVASASMYALPQISLSSHLTSIVLSRSVASADEESESPSP